MELVSGEGLTLEEVERELEKIRKEREGKWNKYGRDGIIVSEKVVYKYRGVPFEILRAEYFSFNVPNPLDATILGKGHYYLLEYVKEEPWISLHELIYDFFGKMWLWEDTCHYSMSSWDDVQQVEWLMKRAKEDIDWLIDEAVGEVERVKRRIEEVKSKLEEMVTSNEKEV